MDTPTIIALIACIGACISGIAAALSAYLSYKGNRPKIKLKIMKDYGQCFYSYLKNKSFALATFKISNCSSIPGTIHDICIIYNGKEYEAEDIFTNFDPSPMVLTNTTENGIKRDINKLRLKCPITVNGFSFVDGFIYFPTFPTVTIDSITVDIRYRVAHSNRIRYIRKARFSHMNYTTD